MEEVYRTRDTRLGRHVAIKILSKELSEAPNSAGIRFQAAVRVSGMIEVYREIWLGPGDSGYRRSSS
jgi:serine/threonine protein kinase